MSAKVYWTELIGFDNEKKDFGVAEFLEKCSGDIESVALLIYNIDFVNEYNGLLEEENLSRGVCSYYGHGFNNDRAIQQWTNFQLKELVSELHKHNVKVLFSIFDMYTYLDENDNVTNGGFTEKHPELRAFISSDFKENASVMLMKHFSDGTPYCDYFIEKLSSVLSDFGFDGYHLADGLSSPRLCIQSGDFSDDIVGQFIGASKVILPDEVAGKCDKNKKKHIARYNY
ncbi:MAG: hypothetical protein IIV97_02495, partial [Oscillospiraceae bacterium]|nr:hypothetical protein [Oscillospiraceae bacterium]